MKAKIFVATVLFAAIFVSCKDKEENKASETAAPAEPAVVNHFVVDMTVIAPQKDDFAVYYTEDGTNNFKGEQAVWSGTKPEAGSQTVTFHLPEEVVPTQIRFDFGMNKDQGDITLEKFKFTYYGKTFEAIGSDFFRYFLENKDIKTEVDPAKGTITFKRNPEKYMTPYFYPNQPLIDEIAKMTK